MAKGLNLIDTNMLEFHLHRTNGDAHIKARFELIDDGSEKVAQDYYEIDFSKMPVALKASANAFFRLLSQEINNKAVNENKTSWTDI